MASQDDDNAADFDVGRGAHAGAAAEREAKIGAGKVLAGDALADLAGLIAGQDEGGGQLSLLDDADEPECLFAGPVRHVADTFAAAKGRGAGRPKGSKNKANQLFRDYLLAKGYRHPGLNLADMANADPKALAAELSCKAHEAAQLVMRANAELMPYFESRRPQEVNVSSPSMGVLVIQQGPARQEDERKTIDITGGVADAGDDDGI